MHLLINSFIRVYLLVKSNAFSTQTLRSFLVSFFTHRSDAIMASPLEWISVLANLRQRTQPEQEISNSNLKTKKNSIHENSVKGAEVREELGGISQDSRNDSGRSDRRAFLAGRGRSTGPK